MKTVIIVNPEAGGISDLAEFEDDLGPLAESEILVTARPGEGRDLAKHAATSGAERIVAAGGDGTVNEVVNGIVTAGEDLQLGILPLGTANDYARSLEIPLDMDDAVAVLVAGGERRVDLVETRDADGRIFANLAVGGFGAGNGEGADDESKSRWGNLAYLLEAAGELPDLDSYRVRIQCDDSEPDEMDVISLVVANGSSTGGGIRVAPQARLDDGRLEVVAIPALGAAELADLASRMLAGTHLEDDRVIVRHARRVILESAPPMPYRADGEDLGTGRLDVTVRPSALRVLVAEPADENTE